MVRYCFVSLNLIGHCDFGGGSFARTASLLRRQGHEVEWVLSHDFDGGSELRTVERLAEEGITVEGPSTLLLSGFQQDAASVARSVSELTQYLQARKVDVVVIDKMCTYANLAAQRAGLPFANVGTDGLSWAYTKRRGYQWLEHGDHHSPSFTAAKNLLGGDNWPQESRATYWGRSPFLNLSFFPRAFYHDRQHGMPACSHFVGAPREASAEKHEREHLLVALGNTFDRAALEPLLRILEKRLRAAPSIKALLLPGDSPFARDLAQLPNVSNPDWMPYDKAFEQSFACIGHGGMNFIWHALHSRVAPLLVPSGIGDQLYNATQMQQHGALVEFPKVSALAKVPGLRRFSVSLSKDKTDAAVNRLLENKDGGVFPLEDLATAMETGGGVPAAARLLEELAVTGAPATECPTGPCCC